MLRDRERLNEQNTRERKLQRKGEIKCAKQNADVKPFLTLLKAHPMKEVVLMTEIVANFVKPFTHICQKAGATLTKLNTESDGFAPAEVQR